MCVCVCVCVGPPVAAGGALRPASGREVDPGAPGVEAGSAGLSLPQTGHPGPQRLWRWASEERGPLPVTAPPQQQGAVRRLVHKACVCVALFDALT